VGLKQNFRFQFERPEDVEAFLEEFSDVYVVDRQDRVFSISEPNGTLFKFLASIEDFGLQTDRAGEYFQFVGMLVERLTGKFGKLEIEDT
jgi:hypothetical protein